MATANFNHHFPGYEILGELAVSNARVLKARNHITGEIVAIKHFHLNTDSDTLRRFQRESEIMTSIQNPYVVKIIDVQLDAPLPYLVMEFVEGGDLRSLLKTHGTADVATTIRLGLQMAEAFKAIHEKGVIHRDVKPENIMYRTLQNGELHFLLTDFGVAKVREQQATLTGHVMMTYEYASPEQFDDPKNIGSATDYYSLGVVLYECLAGTPPFQLVEGRMHTLITQVMNTAPPDLQPAHKKILPQSLQALITGLLAKKPVARINDPIQLKRLLKTADLEAAEGFAQPAIAPLSGAPLFANTQHTMPMPVQHGKTLSITGRKPAVANSFFVPLTVVLFFAGLLIFTGIQTSSNRRHEPASPASSTPDNRATTTDTLLQGSATLFTSGSAKKPAGNRMHAAALPVFKEPATSLAEGYFTDPFNDNANNWPLADYANATMSTQDGRFVVEGLNNDEACVSVQAFNLNDTLDFFVSVAASWISGVTNNAFGMVCGNYRFYISANGNYLIGYYDNNEFHKLTDWKTSAVIYQNDTANNLSIIKNNSQLHFFINSNEVDNFESEPEIGKYYGLYVSGKQTVAFDDFTMRGEPLVTNTFSAGRKE